MAKKNIFRLSITIVLILVLAGIVFYPKLEPLFKSNEEPALQRNPRGMGAGQPLFASGYVLVPSKMSELIYSTGSLLPDEEVDLAFETSGKVVGIYFDEGRGVKKGELLAKINDKPLQAQLLKLQAQKKLVEEREFRQRQLLDRDAISRESYDQVATELQSIEADIMLIQARIAETEMRAPFDGVVGLRMISEGAYATTQTKIVRLVKTRPLKIEFSIPERYAGEVAPGFPISFVVDGFAEPFNAKVYAIDPKVDINTRTIVVRALYPNSGEELKPGRFASVRARLSEIENTVSIPTEALIAEMSGEKVFIYEKGKAKEVKVTTGLRTESHIQIRTGLNFGDTLLTTAILQLREGLPVKLDTLVTNQQQTVNK
ncbi:membrane fusion protein, multidrug efflux system [Mariniphaga anaerophila]|uniref:Membrane fusion protein, multidrug efflux system n=1 Tax=Mariniphaga anaerophila TaxID=1484053 RepID=A0A1M5C909_9BACT|nr:efflux RND transporter periplasmic adaptor subunit [Mariniphaga anaerophila]SHF51233.1 membrane fusion protein, multidrug efflux system [Mariniphaga anaerophila]